MAAAGEETHASAAGGDTRIPVRGASPLEREPREQGGDTKFGGAFAAKELREGVKMTRGGDE